MGLFQLNILNIINLTHTIYLSDTYESYFKYIDTHYSQSDETSLNCSFDLQNINFQYLIPSDVKDSVKDILKTQEEKIQTKILYIQDLLDKNQFSKFFTFVELYSLLERLEQISSKINNDRKLPNEDKKRIKNQYELTNYFFKNIPKKEDILEENININKKIDLINQSLKQIPGIPDTLKKESVSLKTILQFFDYIRVDRKLTIFLKELRDINDNYISTKADYAQSDINRAQLLYNSDFLWKNHRNKFYGKPSSLFEVKDCAKFQNEIFHETLKILFLQNKIYDSSNILTNLKIFKDLFERKANYYSEILKEIDAHKGNQKFHKNIKLLDEGKPKENFDKPLKEKIFYYSIIEIVPFKIFINDDEFDNNLYFYQNNELSILESKSIENNKPSKEYRFFNTYRSAMAAFCAFNLLVIGIALYLIYRAYRNVFGY